MRRQFRFRRLAAMLVIAALFILLSALWIPVKAALGQALLASAWERRGPDGTAPRPWPWADTRPVAVLRIPRLGLRQFVLEGASGRNLAWGPTALTDPRGTDLVLSGHRDTHFLALSSLQAGDVIEFEGPARTRTYRVAWLDVVHSERQRLVLDPGRERLTLVTCWPFDALAAGGPLRFVATALPLERDRGPQFSSQGGTGKSLPRRNSGFQSLDW